jgi:hypothetical protein
MSPKLIHYYHLYSQGYWMDAWEEHIKKVQDSGLYDRLESIKVGMVGAQINRDEAAEIVKVYDKVEIAASLPGGWEQETLDVIYNDIHSSEEETYVLYAHTKGSAYRSPISVWWRRDMNKHTIGRWQESIALLDDEYDATGIYWRTMPMLGKRSPVMHPHFSGNFWWAKASYLRTLGKPVRGNRYDAEAWIGYNVNIKQFDLYPGAPKVQGPVNLPPRVFKKLYSGETVTVFVNDNVQGPFGQKLRVGQVIELPNLPYVQILISSGAVTLWT